MQRREFITLFGGVAVSVSFPAFAQQAERMRRVGVLMAYAESDKESQARVAIFRQELQKLGWTEGRNIQIDIRWAPVDAEKINRFARELVASKPDVVLSSTTSTTEALLQQTLTLPVIFATVADPVGSKFVAKLSRPGGNVTGFTNLEGSMAGKWLELLKQIAPGVDRIALLFNPATTPYVDIFLGPFRAAAAALAVEAIATPVVDTSTLDSTVAAFASAPNGGFVVMPGPFMSNRSGQLTSLAALHRLPAVFPFRYYVELGGLMSYGSDQYDNYRRAASYVDRILRGEKAGELPVQAPIKFELTINLKTARALGLTVSPTLLAQADEVIE